MKWTCNRTKLWKTWKETKTFSDILINWGHTLRFDRTNQWKQNRSETPSKCFNSIRAFISNYQLVTVEKVFICSIKSDQWFCWEINDLHVEKVPVRVLLNYFALRHIPVVVLRFPIIIYLMSVYWLEYLRIQMLPNVSTFNKLFNYLEDKALQVKYFKFTGYQFNDYLRSVLVIFISSILRGAAAIIPF